MLHNSFWFNKRISINILFRQSAGTSIENEEEQRIGLLSSLRSQIITSALQVKIIRM